MKALVGALLLSTIVAATWNSLPSRGAGRGSSTTAIQDTSFSVVNFGTSAYRVNGVNNATLTLTRGQTCVFNVSAIGHPFYIKTTRITGIGDQYPNGVTGQGTTSGPVTFVVPLDAPDQLFYQCGVHLAMGGTLNIANPVGVPRPRAQGVVWLGPATPNPAREGASFAFALPRSAPVELVLFDEHGRKVRELAGGVQSAGEHAVRWDGRDDAGHLVPTGAYFYRLRVEGRQLSGRLVMRR